MGCGLLISSDPRDWKASPDGLVFSRISEMNAQALELPFSVEEVLSTLHDMDGDKLLGRTVSQPLFGNCARILLSWRS